MVELFGLQFCAGAQQAGDGLTGRIVKERLQQVFHSVAARFRTWHAGREHVARAIFLMLDVAFVFEHLDQRAHGGIAGRVRQCGQDFGCGGASTLVRQDLYRRPRLLSRAKVVVWEFVERDIRLGAEGWQIVPLPPTEAGNQTAGIRSALHVF